MGVPPSVVTTLLLRASAPIVCVPPARPDDVALVVFRGTHTILDFVGDDLRVAPRRWPPGSQQGWVHGGFARRTRRLLGEVEDFVDAHSAFVLGGHSLGSACCCLAASDLHRRGKRVVAVHAFGMPRLATPEFQRAYRSQGLWDRTNNYVTPTDPVVGLIPYRVYGDLGIRRRLEFEAASPWEAHDLHTYHRLVTDAERDPTLPQKNTRRANNASRRAEAEC